MSGCWLWLGHADSRGYGTVRDGKMKKAHRLSWEIHHGPIPDALCVCHHCDNPSCVNPAHLFLGAYADNNADRDRKGRGGALGAPPGERNPRARLRESDVVAIRAAVAAEERRAAIAHRFGVTTSTISMVARRKTWASVL